MATYTYSNGFSIAGVGVNGVTVNAWNSGRFSGAPAENSAPPSGSADATTTTGTAAGFSGAFTIALPISGTYYLSMAYAGNTYWQGPVVALAANPSISASTYPYTHRLLANSAGGIAGDRKVGLIGDSTTWGFHDLLGIGVAQTLAKLLQSAGYPSALGMTVPKYNAVVVSDSRWSVGSGWSIPSTSFVWAAQSPMYVGVNGTAANTLTFTPSGGFAYDTFDIWYMQTTGAGGFDAAIDSGSATTTATNGSSVVKKVTITGTVATNHVVKIGNITGGGGGSVFIIGIEPSLSTTPKVRIGNVGVNGATTANWINEAQSPLGPLYALEVYAADLWIINLGINDADASVSVATYIANLQTLVTACQTTGDVIVCSPVPSNSSGGQPATQALYAAGLPAFCATNNCKFLDIFNIWGGATGYSTLNPFGYYYDSFHPSQNVGYPDLARLYAKSILGD